MHKTTRSQVQTFLENCRGKYIAVIGDVILDHYFWGSVHRISPEAPVPVVDIEKETYHLGGAANVAKNLRSLGISPMMIGVIGDDHYGNILMQILRNSNISDDGIYTEENRPTTVKTRVMGNNQHIVRLDRESNKPIDSELNQTIFHGLFGMRENLAGIIFEDYNKGVITTELITQTIAFANEYKIPVFVDPKSSNFFAYKDATVFKPNKKETEDALGKTLNSDDDIISAGGELLERLQAENILLTLGSRGMMLFEKGGEISSVSAKARHIADVSGAGDTVIATLSAMVAGGASMRVAAEIANIAASVVCQEPGIVSIEKSALLLGIETF